MHDLDRCSLDSLLKIAHFPALRSDFEREFTCIIVARSNEWQRLYDSGYRVFRYDKFLANQALRQEM